MGRLKTLPPRVTTKLARQVSTSPTERIRGSRWMKVRSEVMRRANGLCECAECREAGRLRLASEVDHIVPLHQGGDPIDGRNLMAMHPDCHAAKTAREAAGRANG